MSSDLKSDEGLSLLRDEVVEGFGRRAHLETLHARAARAPAGAVCTSCLEQRKYILLIYNTCSLVALYRGHSG